MKFIIVSTILFALLTGFAFGENVNLFWDAVTTDISGNPAIVTSYNMRRGNVANGPYTVVGIAPQALNPLFIDAAVDLTTDKFYVVTAVDNTGKESGFSSELRVTAEPPTDDPGIPSNFGYTITVTTTTTIVAP